MKSKGLPKGIVKLPNSDKDGRHHADSENALMPYFPSVLIVCGKKGSGKTNLTLNLISKATPLYDRIVIVHGAGEASSEYQDLIDGSEVVEEIPGPDFWDPDQKNCLVIEEQPWGMFNRAQMSAAERCVNFTSSHRSVQVFIVVQNIGVLCPTIKRSMDYLLIAPHAGCLDQLYDLKRRTGVDFKLLMEDICQDRHDFVCMDFTGHGPKLRRNMFDIIEDNGED